MSYASQEEELRRVCLHEHGHQAISRHYRPDTHGWVKVERLEPGALIGPSCSYYSGVSYSEPLRYAKARHAVGWAGAAAEMLDESWDVTPLEVFDRCTSGAFDLSEADLELIGRPRLADLVGCIELLRHYWPAIVAGAAATAAAVVTEETRRALAAHP